MILLLFWASITNLVVVWDRVWDDVIATMPNVTIARLLDSRTGKVVTEISLKRDAPRALLPGPTMTLEGLFKPLAPEEP